MLEKVLTYIHNRFERDRISGTFTVEDGELPLFLLEDQYYWVEGSVFNDGLHQHPAHDLRDETFRGTITSMAVPKALLDIVDEIEDWQERNGQVADGPYQSESFGGYSYTKASTGGSGDSAAPTGWQAQFGPRLIPWRKLS